MSLNGFDKNKSGQGKDDKFVSEHFLCCDWSCFDWMNCLLFGLLFDGLLEGR